MNHDPSGSDLPAALRLRLRGLRTDAPPALATAAVLAMAIGLGWQLRPDTPEFVPAPADAVPDALPEALPAPLVVEADAMAREYEGALLELSAARPPTAEPAALLHLDASAEAVRDALAQDPDALFLLQRLQRIYAQRLSLTQRLARA
ncbi:hypothetical protein FZO89_15380 [Luteimonas viscosa]|uniref:Uncharacterized protein n=1 Tax=Luteimonas viscosa TaxID=1132694 RepID=A0A5D4XI47_9GAMM|nr:hypothetical protein [Luteimonas viscosa]TYT23623.1 hypothetical protein FZO89_15380 [Luteimonas viscosa]